MYKNIFKFVFVLSLILSLHSIASAQNVVANNPTTQNPPVIFNTKLSVGSRGAQVSAVQKLLIAKGYLAPGLATGYYGNLTRSAVANFQLANNLPQVGQVGPRTIVALNNIITSNYSTPSTPTSPNTTVNNLSTNNTSTSSNSVTSNPTTPSTPTLPPSTPVNPTASCVTTSPSSITVKSPNGGENYNFGDIVYAEWESCNLTNKTVSIYLAYFATPATQPTSVTELKGSTTDDGFEVVVLPSNIANTQSGDYYKMLIVEDPSSTASSTNTTRRIYDYSDKTFTVN